MRFYVIKSHHFKNKYAIELALFVLTFALSAQSYLRAHGLLDDVELQGEIPDQIRLEIQRPAKHVRQSDWWGSIDRPVTLNS